ncbi:MAG: response regulator transcription factor [Lachnospiraceae bacterium]|nr:response regulator transcription factor [Lachnospiraceae bacterium]
METLLIADDEKNIRDGLKCILDWEELGFTLCGEAANGEEALSCILKEKPSLVLLDIRMPKLTGIDIIRIAREQGYSGRFIILSGYSDFSYAQSAIRYGVTYYLTKPIDEDELLDAINTIKEALEQEHKKSDNIALYREKAKNVILHELVTGNWKKDGITGLSSSDFQSMELVFDTYQVVIYEKFGLAPEDPSYHFADLLNITNNGNHSFEYFKEDNKNVILLKGAFARRRFEEFLHHYEKAELQEGSPMDSLFLAYGRPVENLDEIYRSYEEAHTLIQRRFFCIQGQHTLGYEELPAITSHNSLIHSDKLHEYCDARINYLPENKRTQIAATCCALAEYLYNVDSSIESVRLFLTDLFLQLKENINKTYNSSRVSLPSNSAIIEHIDHCHYLYEIILYISGQVKSIMDSNDSSPRDSILDDILYYIDNNYQNNIKLETIAPLFGYNSASIGKLFTKAIGENFNSYVDHRRIEHSKKLLSQKNMKVYEVSEQVGYKNVDYFHKKFKKYVGISPAEYRKQLKLDESM